MQIKLFHSGSFTYTIQNTSLSNCILHRQMARRYLLFCLCLLVVIVAASSFFFFCFIYCRWRETFSFSFSFCPLMPYACMLAFFFFFAGYIFILDSFFYVLDLLNLFKKNFFLKAEKNLSCILTAIIHNGSSQNIFLMASAKS